MSADLAHVEIARIASVLGDVPDEHASWMSDSEQARLAGIGFAGRRSQYLAGHWLTRVLLARAFGGTPASWRLRERKGLPPQVAGHDASIRVSISHTSDWIAAAVATVAVGIDLEQRPRALDASIESLLRNGDEAAGSLDPDALLQRWVAKEAWIKRNTESALPAQLKRLHVRSVARECADVCIDSHAAFHLGVAIAHGCAVSRRCEVALVPGIGVAITDLQPDAQ